MPWLSILKSLIRAGINPEQKLNELGNPADFRFRTFEHFSDRISFRIVQSSVQIRVTRPRMASAILSGAGPLVLPDMEQCKGAEGDVYLEWVSQFVSAHRHKTLTLKRPADVVLRIAELSDTIYKDNHKQLRSWGKFCLPNEVNMHVVGFMEDGCGQLILMTCEDKKLYVYDGEELHEVASSLEQLRHKEIEYPALKTYYYGEPFKDMTAKDWEEVRKSDVGQRLDKEHEKLVQDSKATFLEMLSSQK